MDGRRRGGKGIEEEGKGWSGGRAPPCVGPGGTPGGPGPLWLAWRMVWRMAREGVRRGPFNGGCLPGPFDECPALRGASTGMYILLYACMSLGQRSPVQTRLRGLAWKVVWLPVEHPLDIYLHPMK